MRQIAVLIALCVAGCQFHVVGLAGDAPSGPQQAGPAAADLSTEPAALDADAPADLRPAPDLAGGTLPQPPPPPPNPPDCRTTGCPPHQVCVPHDNSYECRDKFN